MRQMERVPGSHDYQFPLCPGLPRAWWRAWHEALTEPPTPREEEKTGLSPSSEAGGSLLHPLPSGGDQRRAEKRLPDCWSPQGFCGAYFAAAPSAEVRA